MAKRRRQPRSRSGPDGENLRFRAAYRQYTYHTARRRPTLDGRIARRMQGATLAGPCSLPPLTDAQRSVIDRVATPRASAFATSAAGTTPTRVPVRELRGPARAGLVGLPYPARRRSRRDRYLRARPARDRQGLATALTLNMPRRDHSWPARHEEQKRRYFGEVVARARSLHHPSPSELRDKFVLTPCSIRRRAEGMGGGG